MADTATISRRLGGPQLTMAGGPVEWSIAQEDIISMFDDDVSLHCSIVDNSRKILVGRPPLTTPTMCPVVVLIRGPPLQPCSAGSIHE